MIEYRKLSHEDYSDIIDLCKGIWDGTDYLPELFHDWVDDKGMFMGAVDTDTNKVIGVDKYTLLHDGTGWLEGLRTHKDYRGRGIGKELALKVLGIAQKDLENGIIRKIAFATHITSVESINMMTHLGFKLEQQYIFVEKAYKDADSTLSLENYSVENWSPSYEEFKALDYLKRRNNILPFAFCFQTVTPELHKELMEGNYFISINGHKGLFKFKGEPHFIVFDESPAGINAFMNYYLLLLSDKYTVPPMTSVMPSDIQLIDALKAYGFNPEGSWVCDYLYFVYK